MTMTLSERMGMPLIQRAITAHAARNDDDPTIEKEIGEAFVRHLKALLEAGIVVPHVATPNRRINEIGDWNAMFGVEEGSWTTPEEAMGRVASRIMHSMVSVHLMMASFGLRDGRDPAEAIGAAVRAIDSGSTRSHLCHMEVQDHVSGEELSYRIEHWNPVLYRKDDPRTIQDAMAGVKRVDVLAADIGPAGPRSVVIDLPSGDVAITDWFRVDGFTDHVDDGDPYRGASERESEAESIRYAELHGFTSVRTCTTSIRVVTDGRIHAVVSFDEDEASLPEGYTVTGHLSYDLRQVTIADARTVRDILERIHPDDDEKVDVLQREAMRDEVVRIRTETGPHRIRHSGRGFIEDHLEDGHPLKRKGMTVIMIVEPIERSTDNAEA